MSTPDHVVVPRLTSLSLVFWTAGTAGTAITALGMVSARTWIEPTSGTAGRKLFWWLQRRAPAACTWASSIAGRCTYRS